MKRCVKNAFTMAELLLVLAIIGILMAVAVAVMRPQEFSRRALISSILTNLDKAMYNTNSDRLYFNDNTRQHPFDEDNNGAARLLCNALVSQINIAQNNCDSATAMPLRANDSLFARGTRNRYLQFVTATGAHVFISDRIRNDANSPYFYLIYVDINGNRLPNSATYINRPIRYPDIYVFAAIPLNRVIPMGILETDEHLLTARMFQIRSVDGTQTHDDSHSYAEAKSQAWGFYTSTKTMGGSLVQTDITQQVDLEGVPFTEMFDEPYAYNDYIRNTVTAGNPNFLQNITFPISNNDIQFACLKDEVEDQAIVLDESDGFYDGSCAIQIDEYTY